MSNLKINNEIELNGRFTVERKKDINANPVIIYRTGVLEIPKYIDEIKTIENDKYKINGINVYKETFVSEEDYIAYEFKFDEIFIKDN
ncbi:hypothetical protein DWZ11_00515 [Megamonas rupellensis]|jgi:hypothetical protein|uniref:Uncharacterized protein n=1 Tax=Megamonas rupellensis TaxID=491921 RepID=A0A411ZZZ4_9FIRM|nr:hypothetical protein [Megamonas rupellensis]RGQ08374.1 hypothetical protein DWZ11_00515 [Megamonas rupellensis]